MIRVLQIVSTLGYGGVAQLLLNYYSRMDKTEILFDFITHGGVEDFHADLIQQGSRIFYVDTISKSGLRNYIAQLNNVLSNNHFDIIHTHDGDVTGVTAYFCKKYYDGPIICHAHATRCPNPKHTVFLPILRFMARRYSDVLLGCGRMASEFCFGKRAAYTVIHNAVDFERFASVPSADAFELKARLGIKDDTFVIGHVGAFVWQKNHAFLIPFAEQLRMQKQNICFVLVGDGPLREKIEHQVSERKLEKYFRFAGRQSNVPLYMKMFDLFVLPSENEGLPVVGVEAQAAGLRCLMSDTIDRDVDVGAGLVDFLPICTDSIQYWVRSALERRGEVDSERIRRQFFDRKYDVQVSSIELVNIYRDLLLRKPES